MSKSRSVSSDGHTQWWGKPPQLSWSPWSLLFAPPSTVSPSSSPCAHAPKAPSSKPCRHWHAWWSFPPMLWSIQQGIDGLCRQSFSDASSNDNNSIKSVSSCSSRISSDSSHHASEALLVKQWKQMWSNCELEKRPAEIKCIHWNNAFNSQSNTSDNPSLQNFQHSKKMCFLTIAFATTLASLGWVSWQKTRRSRWWTPKRKMRGGQWPQTQIKQSKQQLSSSSKNRKPQKS